MSRRGNAAIRTSISIGERIVNSFSESDARSAQLSQAAPQLLLESSQVFPKLQHAQIL